MWIPLDSINTKEQHGGLAIAIPCYSYFFTTKNTMKISQIAVYQVTLPLEHPYRLSGGRLYFDKLDSTIIAIDTDEGIRGWGEGCPWGSTYLPAFPRGIRAGIEELAPPTNRTRPPTYRFDLSDDGYRLTRSSLY